MKRLIVVVLLVSVIGKTHLARVRGDARLAELHVDKEDAIVSTLDRQPRHTANNECGVRGQVLNTLIAGGEDASVNEFPWHVGIYRLVVNKPHAQDCGGSLLSRTIVLTAAHCFWQESQRRLKPHTIYKVAAGKYLRSWSQQEVETQVRDVAEIHVPKRYRGRGSNFQYDIAVVKLAQGVDFTASVKPVCMDWTKAYEASQLSPGVKGTVVGWGSTLEDAASEVLQKVDLPFVDFDTCFNSLRESVKKLYTDDKFCAGFANKSRSVCTGDSGGGLVFTSRDRYFLRGVVSISFRPETNRDPCYAQLYTGFTLVSQYLPWIKTFVDAEHATSGIVTQAPPKKSKSEEMCEAYSTAVYESVELPSSTSIQVSTCAMSPAGVSNRRLLSQPREFPHMAALGYTRMGDVNYLCNGNLISEQFVLVAAHCATAGNLNGQTLSHVRLGTVSLNDNSTQPGLKIVGVAQVIVYPGYNKKFNYHDIALLKLNESVTFNGYVRPACLDPSPSLLAQEIVTSSSWGRASNDFGDIYENLLQGDLRIVENNQCREEWASKAGVNRKLPNGVTTENMVCFDPVDESTDCSLTSGSPMMVKLSEPFCMYRIVGFVTFGQSGACRVGVTRLPSIGMRVSAYTPWIESVVWPTPEDDDDDDAANDNDDDVIFIRDLTPQRQARPSLGNIVFPK